MSDNFSEVLSVPVVPPVSLETENEVDGASENVPPKRNESKPNIFAVLVNPKPGIFRTRARETSRVYML